MAQTPEGAVLVAAQHIGVTPEEYRSRVANGEKWCTGCKAWHARSAFGSDAATFDGLAGTCLERRRQRYNATHVRTGRKSRLGVALVDARDGDKKQARARVNHACATGLLPRPNTLPCTDCGHVWAPGERRHEYDHHLGYAAEHQLDVQAVCTRCHARRDNKRIGATHCIRGHEFTAETTGYKRNGTRYCLACQRKGGRS